MIADGILSEDLKIRQADGCGAERKLASVSG